MKKRLFLLAVIMALVVAIFAITASAAEPSYKDGEWIYAADGTTKLAIRDTDGNPLIWYMNGEELKYVRADQTDTTQAVYVVYKIQAGGNGFDTSKLNPQKCLKDIDIYDGGTQIECAGINSALVLINLEKLDIDALNGWLWGNKNGCCTQMRGIVFPNTLKGIGQEGFTNTKLVQAWNFENTQYVYDNACSPFATPTFTQEATNYTFEHPDTMDFAMNLQRSQLKTIILSENMTNGTRYQYFRQIKTLEKIMVPVGVTSFGAEAFRELNNNYLVFFTGTQEQATNLKSNTNTTMNGTFTTNAEIISYETYLADPTTYDNATNKPYIIYDSNYCYAFYKNEHLGDDHDCTTENYCERCKETFAKQADTHDVTESLTYPNGFDKAGVYNHFCNRAGCTMAGAEARDGEKAPIIISKGYSRPESNAYVGINAGFEIKKELLDLYNSINNDLPSFSLFMINSQIDGITITKVLEGETLELASGVKGVNVIVESNTYNSISIEVRGFSEDDGQGGQGSFYTLQLITAMAVKTKDGVHFVQAELQNSPNTTVNIDGVDFNVATANNIYNPTSQS